jgi:hypothetical protein
LDKCHHLHHGERLHLLDELPYLHALPFVGLIVGYERHAPLCA